MVHVNTFRDFAESGLVTWGQRFVRDHHADVFGGANPYSCIELSDRFGSHANVANPTLPEHKVLTISRLCWFDDPGRPKAVTADKPLDPAAGHILAHVDDVGEGGEGSEPYREFYDQAGKRFTLRSPGHPDVRASAHGYWLDAGAGVREFYVHVLPEDFARMDRHVAYALVPEETPGDHVWKVADGVTITRP
jgi:hypothetical protein